MGKKKKEIETKEDVRIRMISEGARMIDNIVDIQADLMRLCGMDFKDLLCAVAISMANTAVAVARALHESPEKILNILHDTALQHLQYRDEDNKAQEVDINQN